MKRNLYVNLVFLVALVMFTSCNPSNEPTSGTQVSGKTIATTSVKTFKLINWEGPAGVPAISRITYDSDFHPIVYQNFRYAYSIDLYGDRLVLVPYILSSWGEFIQMEYTFGTCGIHAIGAVKSISDITSGINQPGQMLVEVGHYGPFYAYGILVMPNYGYTAHFTTDEGTTYMRIYVKDYTMKGADLVDVTVQYQLYTPEIIDE